MVEIGGRVKLWVQRLNLTTFIFSNPYSPDTPVSTRGVGHRDMMYGFFTQTYLPPAAPLVLLFAPLHQTKKLGI
jgi:hypothetical protein